MRLFDKIFGYFKKKEPETQGFFRLLNGYTPVFTSWEGSLYEQELCRAAINCKATHVSKLRFTSTGKAQQSLQMRLKHSPNGWQTWGQFLYRVSTILDVRNTAFVVPVLDDMGSTTGIYPICPTSWELVTVQGNPWLRFTFDGAQRSAIELEKVGILTRFQYKNDFFGSSNDALQGTLDLIKIQRQGIEEYSKNSSNYRFMAKVTNFSFAKDLAQERQRFDRENFQTANGGGLLLFPNTYSDIKQITQQSYLVNSAQLKLIQENVYTYFGVNDDVLQNKAFGDAFTAYYEGAIEPFAVQLSETLSKMLFTERERSFGAGVTFTANRLQFMSNNDKLTVSRDMLDRGIMSLNEVREIWQLDPVEGGDIRIIRGEYYPTGEKLQERKTDGQN